MSQADLAELSGLTPQHISNLERGQKGGHEGKAALPSIDAMGRIAEALGLPIEDLARIAGEDVKMPGGVMVVRETARPYMPHPIMLGIPRTTEANAAAHMIDRLSDAGRDEALGAVTRIAQEDERRQEAKRKEGET